MLSEYCEESLQSQLVSNNLEIQMPQDGCLTSTKPALFAGYFLFEGMLSKGIKDSCWRNRSTETLSLGFELVSAFALTQQYSAYEK